MLRRAEFRPFGWLNDLHQRQQLELDPPYQRRSVWSDQYRLDFINTVLMGYPCPAIFLYEEIRADGSFVYKVVDGKQRITTLLSFVRDEFPVDEDSGLPEAGRYFRDLPEQSKLNIWRYAFVVEFVAQENVAIINEIFNRINKNVAKLSHQELRHAQFSGEFISTVEAMSDYAADQLTESFPRITKQSRRQMKDVENVALLFVFLESGERSTSQADLDEYFASREEAWADRDRLQQEFQTSVRYIRSIVQAAPEVQNTRLRNQAEFYSLFAAVVELARDNELPPAVESAARLAPWAAGVTRTPVDELEEIDVQYVAAARAASNDPGPRRIRINRVKEVILG